MVTTRAVDAILSPDYVGDLGGSSVDELQDKKQECASVETAVSYYRRLAQGRIEILRAWADRTSADTSVESLVADLPRILAAGSSRAASMADVRHTDAAPEIVDLDLEGREHLVSDEKLANLPLLNASEIAEAIAELEGFEQELSVMRRGLHSAINAIEAEIATRQATDSLG